MRALSLQLSLSEHLLVFYFSALMELSSSFIICHKIDCYYLMAQNPVKQPQLGLPLYSQPAQVLAPEIVCTLQGLAEKAPVLFLMAPHWRRLKIRDETGHEWKPLTDWNNRGDLSHLCL